MGNKFFKNLEHKLESIQIGFLRQVDKVVLLKSSHEPIVIRKGGSYVVTQGENKERIDGRKICSFYRDTLREGYCAYIPE